MLPQTAAICLSLRARRVDAAVGTRAASPRPAELLERVEAAAIAFVPSRPAHGGCILTKLRPL